MKLSRPTQAGARRAIAAGVALLLFVCCASRCISAQTNASVATSPFYSLVIEAAGRVEYSVAGNTNWQRATVGIVLRPGDRLRTFAESRAAVQLSDRSVVRLNARTTLEILAPHREEK